MQKKLKREWKRTEEFAAESHSESEAKKLEAI